MSQVFAAAGTHVLADLSGVEGELLTNPAAFDTLLREAALAAGATILHSHFHSFGSGQGVTGVVLLAESHISIHTWPEAGFAAADIFMCGDCDPLAALAVLRERLQPGACTVRTVQRREQND